jgi:DNA-binding NtrC family response regulator
VLVVDDDSLTRWSLAETLGARGYDIAEAPDAASAISALLSPSMPIAVVLLDVHLPDAADLRVLKALRQISPDTPVILMTAHGSRELAAEALTLGACAVLDKPFELDDVGAAIERALDTRRH